MTEITAKEYREWAAQNGVKHAPSCWVDCASFAEAEEFVRDFPTSHSGFGSSARIEVRHTDPKGTLARGRQMLHAAGYRWSKAAEAWEHDSYSASFTTHDGLRSARIFVSWRAAPVALAQGEGGYLPPGDRPVL